VAADHLGHTLVIGMAVRQGQQARRPPAKLPQDSPEPPARRTIDEHVFHHVDVEHVAWKSFQQPDSVRDLAHRWLSLLWAVVSSQTRPFGFSRGARGIAVWGQNTRAATRTAF